VVLLPLPSCLTYGVHLACASLTHVVSHLICQEKKAIEHFYEQNAGTTSKTSRAQPGHSKGNTSNTSSKTIITAIIWAEINGENNCSAFVHEFQPR